MNEDELDYREFIVWELAKGNLEYSELAVTDMGHLHVYVREKVMSFTNSAPSLEEFEYLGKKPIVVCSRESNYWLLIYEKGQAVVFEQFVGAIN